MSDVSTAPARTGAAAMPAWLVIGLLALLLGLQPVTTDLYLPALPALKDQLQASMAQSQLTLMALLLSFGCSQLVWGPLSDRWGRRPAVRWVACWQATWAGAPRWPRWAALAAWRCC